MNVDPAYTGANETLSTLGVLIAIFAFILTFAKSCIFVPFLAYYTVRSDLTECQACSQFDVPVQAIQIDSLAQDQLQSYESCAMSSVDVTQNFRTLAIFLFLTNMLLLMTTCFFCCMGRNHAKTYDRLFMLYNLLGFWNIVNYIWLIVVRFRHAGMVCSGDLLGRGDQADVISEAAESEYYVTDLGHLLKWYCVIETVLTFCCVSLASAWICYTPNATSRLFVSVEY